jgi:hypothetical protein
MAKSNLIFDYEIETTTADPQAFVGNIAVVGCTVLAKGAEGNLNLKVKNVSGVPTVITSTITPGGSDFERIAKETLSEMEKTALGMVKGYGNGEEVVITISANK